MEKPLEERYIPGITAKQLILFLAGIVSVIITILSTYYSLKSDMRDNATSLEILKSDGKTRDEQIKTIQLQIQTIQLQIATMQAQYNLKNAAK